MRFAIGVFKFGTRCYFRELLAGSEAGIASGFLADRLKRLVKTGLLIGPFRSPNR
ncbi:hypothetical protein [Amycolatopsis sp. lyj-90]|uniref:hypothetical protein n=1 Tax=Amycolatopsis sp. lyj-90 TaxID=2789285 RepID=UPI00397D4FBA